MRAFAFLIEKWPIVLENLPHEFEDQLTVI